MIRLAGVQLTLPSSAGPVEILRGLDLEIAHGETVSVVGPSGSGKSTMMMLIAGLERPSQGGVEVAGADSPRSTRTAWRASGATRSASCSRTST